MIPLRGAIRGAPPLLIALSVLALVACGPPKSSGTVPTGRGAPSQPASGAQAAVVPTVARTTASESGEAPLPASDFPGAGLIAGPLPGEAQSLTGAGATFPAALYSKWFTEYDRLTRVQINYQSIGSGGGIKSISDATVDFGATDGPMTDAQLREAKDGEILHVPAALGAVVPTYNLPGISQPLQFSPESLAGIFLGDVKKWNDPLIAVDNPGVALPNQDIVVVHRSDGSGTTYIWVEYLSNVSEKWRTTVGTATSVNWPVGLGGKGNEGVAGEVKQNPYAMGYVELIYALQNNLGVGPVKNSSGNYVTPSLESVTAAAAGVAENIQPDLRASIVNAPGPDAYPISGFSWLLVYKDQRDPAKATAVTRMLWWAIHDGQRFNADLGYSPLPDGIVRKAEDKILSVTVNGQRAFPGK
jgi:phosphate transport system substrate-binding protein